MTESVLFSEQSNTENMAVEGYVDSGNCENLSAQDNEKNEVGQSVKTDALQAANVAQPTDNEVEKQPKAKDCQDGAESEAAYFEHPFSKPTWSADLTLIVEGKSLYVSKYVLCSCSPVFREMLEKCQVSTLELPDTTFQPMLEFLCCLFQHISKPVTLENIHPVLTLSVKYKVQHLINACEDIIKQKAVASTPCDDLLNLLVLCRELDLNRFAEQCFQVLRGKDPAELKPGDIQVRDGREAVSYVILKLKAERYKEMYDKMVTRHEAMEKERDNYRNMYMFLLDCVSHDEKNHAMSVFGGERHEIRVKFSFSFSSLKILEIYNKPDYIKPISLETFIGPHTNYIEVTDTCSSTVYGQVCYKNFIDEKDSRRFLFFQKFSQNVRSIDLSPPITVIKEPKSGFLLNGVGEIEIQIIAKD